MSDSKQDRTNEEISAEETVRAVITVHNDISNEEITRLIEETNEAVLYDSEGSIFIRYPNGNQANLSEDFSQHPEEYINNETAQQRVQYLTSMNREEEVVEEGADPEQPAAEREQPEGSPIDIVRSQEYIRNAVNDLRESDSDPDAPTPSRRSP